MTSERNANDVEKLVEEYWVGAKTFGNESGRMTDKNLRAWQRGVAIAAQVFKAFASRGQGLGQSLTTKDVDALRRGSVAGRE